MKRVMAWLLAIMMIVTNFATVQPLAVQALDVGNGATVTSVKFIKQHEGYDVVGGNVIIIGSNLEDINVLFEVEGGIPKSLGTKDADSNAFFLNYILNYEEADSFTGKMYIGNQVINLNTPNFPNITSSSTAVVNQDQLGTLTLNGSKLDLINNSTIKGTYGRGIQQNNITESLPATQLPSSISFTPNAPGPLGYQDITLTQTVAGDPAIEVTYYYQNAFRILEDLDLAPVSLYPNAASKGDTITLTSSKFSDAKNYAVYFLNLTDSDFAFSDEKKSPGVVLSADKQRLNVQVPNNNTIALGSKRVVIVDIVNNEIVSRFDLSQNFNLIDAAFSPTIKKINPATGTDEGAKTQIIGRNMIAPVIPELNSTTGTINITSALPTNGNKEMTINYDVTGVTFKDVAVTSLKRVIRTIIGKQAFYELNADNTIKYAKIGADDYLYILTDTIDDAEDDPKKDVVVEIETTILASDGNSYTFSQSVTETDGFEFIPSSVEPSVNAITPDQVQIDQSYHPKEHTLLSIEGEDFFVNKYTDSLGNIKTNYPVVLIQLTDTLGDGDYIVKFDKNDTTATSQGTIYNSTGAIADLPVELVVLDADDQVVDGSVGNELGTRIVLYLPKEISLSGGGKKNIQVINPKRSSDDYGLGDVALDIVDFVIASDTPVIESVEPNIITADSQAEVVITGSNFHDGVRVFIDGIDVGTVTREIGTQGNNITLTFNAPVGRVGKTQIQVVNPLGGLAVRDFYYVRSFNQDPSISSISPNKGTSDTLAIIAGDNFFKPDAAATSVQGLDAYRLIGTRVLFDGDDINTYNIDSLGNIDFVDYTAPSSSTPLFYVEAGKLRTSPFYENTVITSSDDSDVYNIVFDADGNPQLYDGNEVLYTFKHSETDGYQAYDSSANLLGDFSFNSSQITINTTPSISFKLRMNNSLIRATYSLDKELSAGLANYWPSVILQDSTTGDYYTLQVLVDGSLRLSDGQFNVFTIKATGSTVDAPNFKAFDKSSNAYTITQSDTGFVVGTATPLNLKMLTPYAYDSTSRLITGNRVRVATKDKIHISVPNLTSSTGYKTVTVVNPDTKSASLKDGFYYYKLPATEPTISTIQPNIGSIAGGYVVTISGKDFNDSTQIYFDGNQVTPADKVVNLAGTAIDVKVPAYPVDITEVYGVGELAVPVVIVNSDGGSAHLTDGFTYVKPTSTPKINEIILTSGSTNGGEVVEIIGEDFRFFEPYDNVGGGVGYDKGVDTFTNVNGKLGITVAWDDLLEDRYKEGVDLWQKTPMPDGNSYFGYDYYYDSPILPRVYFGGKLAKIVDFANGYIKVITPSHSGGTKPVIVMNNDAGVSNSVNYTFNASLPKINYINPAQGARVGGEQREVIGSGFAKDSFKAYQDDDATSIVDVSDKVQSLLRFGAITNHDIAIGQANDGRINANRATVTLEGALVVSYDGNAQSLVVSLREGGVTYTRTFSNYSTGEVFIPAGMLKDDNTYYQPTGYGYTSTTQFNEDNDYEWIRVEVNSQDKRLYVARGYAPAVNYINDGQLSVMTPSYYTIDKVDVTFFNPDGGQAKSSFTYTNPDSAPIIEAVSPSETIPANSVENSTDIDQKMVQASIQGGIDIEITGRDFRDGVKVYLGTKEASVQDIIEDEATGKQVIIVKVPAAQSSDIGAKLPIIIENTDGGIANSTDTTKLGTDKSLIYFIYRKPLSLPTISEIIPNKTSQYGGNIVEIRGTDFRDGAKVIIGSVGGVPVTPSEIEDVGRYIKFKVPTTLTPGVKDIQVINDDYGTVTFNGGLTVISYPQVEQKIYDEDDNLITTVHTTGQQVIILKGENFQTGAKVIFGGERLLKIDGVTGEEGYYRDDKDYVVRGGTLATNVEFVDENTLKVTTPEIFEEDNYTITVINPDTGISDGDTTISISVPVPSAPTSLKVTTVDNTYIKLYDYLTANIKYYEVYVYIGNKSSSQLTNNNYRDFQSVTTTTYSPYKLTRLAGVTTMGRNDKAYFVVKAVNQYGSSSYSNIAYLDYDDVKDISQLGGGDNDGGLLPTALQAVEQNYQAGKMQLLYTADSFKLGTVLDLTPSQYKDLKQIDIVLPDSIVATNQATMYLQSDYLDINYSPAAFNNANFIVNNTTSTEYVTWQTQWQQDTSTSSALGRLPRGVKAVGPVTAFNYTIANNTGERNLGTLVKPLAVSIKLDYRQITVKTGNYSVYYYDPASYSWTKLSSNYNATQQTVSFSLNRDGYIVLTVPN